jgi:glycosyltransferase involved in cell wall biosynthesis
VLVDLSVAPFGGAATYADGFVRGLIASTDPHKASVVVVVDHRWALAQTELLEALRETGVEVAVADFPPPGTWRARLLRGRVLRDLVRRHQVQAAWFPRDVAPRVPVPSGVLLNNMYAWRPFASGEAIGGRIPAYLLRRAARTTARRSASVVAVSDAMAAAASAVTVDGVIHHGCALPVLRRPHADPDGRVRVGMIANLIENKGVEPVVRAVANVAARGHDAWTLDVYGSRMDPMYAERVESLAVELLGHSPLRGSANGAALVDAYASIDVLVMGGSFESFCHPLVEGMRSGCVVVAPDCPLVHEICGDAAVTYREGSVADLERALLDAVGRRNELSQRGNDRSLAFDWTTTVDLTLAEVRRIGADTDDPAAGVDADRRPTMLVDLSVAPAGGAATYVHGFASGLVDADLPDRDRIVVVLDRHWADDHRDLVDAMRAAGLRLAVETFAPPGTWAARLGRGRVLRRVGRHHRVDVAYFPRDLAPRMRVPVVTLARNLYAWRPFASGAAIGGRVPATLLRWASRETTRRAAAVLAVSEVMAAAVEGAAVDTIVHHGCALPEHPRRRVDAPDPLVVTMIGNLIENKGMEVVVEGVARARSVDDRGWDLRIYGKRMDPVYADLVEALSVERLGASVLQGPAFGDELVAAYHAADVVVMGGTFESFCNPLVEAMRSGCVVVAPACDLVAELCGDVAVTYHELDADSLSEALVIAREQLDERSRRGIERARAFTWTAAVEQTIDAVARAGRRSQAR